MPTDDTPHAHAFILERATGEIEIRAASREVLGAHVLQRTTTHDFAAAYVHESGMHVVIGKKKAVH